uniref:HAT C-terminal dimerisation domain-containing protein n=1 Tax=Sipha flava TaxID=143950 RepID=A0A2S2Q1J7_9HEMI
MQLNESESENEENNEENNTVKLECKSCNNCVVCCYNVLIKYNLYSDAYHCLTMAYQYLLTLPCTQVACERSFYLLKIIKTRLRNSMNEEKLDAFMIMVVEKMFYLLLTMMMLLIC